MYESFGAVVVDHQVEFRLFFPNRAIDPTQYDVGGLPRIARLQVTGNFQQHLGQTDWDTQNAPDLVRGPHPNGMLYSCTLGPLPDGFYQYKYYVTFQDGSTRWCGDPCAKYVASKDENAAFVVGGHDLTVQPIAQRLSLKELVIYELMLDDFTAEFRGGRPPADAMWDKLDHLVELGVTAVEFMPWTAWRGGEFSWGYDPFLFFAVENRYIEDPADPLDRLYRLKLLVNELHRRGLHVIMDGVFNHVSAGLHPHGGFPYHWLYQNPRDSPYTGGYGGDGYFEELDYHNGCTQQLLFDVCQFWLDEYQLDGIRFDYTMGFYDPQDLARGIPRLVGNLRELLDASGRGSVALILEHLPDNRYDAIEATNRIRATGSWYDRLHFDVPQAASSGYAAPGLLRVLDTQRDYAPGRGPVIYTENHDHSTVVQRVGGRQRWWKTQAPLLALFTAPGAVMLHNGQEFGEEYFLPGEGAARVQPRPLHWELLDDATGQWLRELHRRLIQLRLQHPALRGEHFYPRSTDERRTHLDDDGFGVDADRGLVIYHRWGAATDGELERFMIALNLSDVDQIVDVPASVNGPWVELLDGGAVEAEDFRLASQRIPSNWGRIFYRKG